MLYVLEHLGEESFVALVTSRAGMSWFGGLAAALSVSVWQFRYEGWPVVDILAAATPALALGHLLGRVGCFLVGDDYGTPTSLPWGIAFPEGLLPTTIPVHPTQLYEAIALGVMCVFPVRWRRQGNPPAVVLGRYLVGTGGIRFGIEFLRVNQRVLVGLTLAHMASAMVVLAGFVLLARSDVS